MEPQNSVEIIDEFCNPDNPIKVEFDDIKVAYRRLEDIIPQTPCVLSNLSAGLKLDLYLKQEFVLHTGCYNERGVLNSLMKLTEIKHGVTTASLGNHGIALAYCAQKHTPPLECTVVMPTISPANKVAKTQKFGANVIIHGSNLAEAQSHALAISKDNASTFINGSDHPGVIEGNGVIGFEILDQIPDVQAVVVPVGGGGLLAGIAVAVKQLRPTAAVYGVETEKTCTLVEALKKKQRVFTHTNPTSVAESLGVNIVGVNAFRTLKGLVEKMVVVKEEWVSRAILRLVEEDKIIVEGAGAVAVASILAGLYPQLKGKKVVCILSGSNIDSTILGRVLEHGLAVDGRLVKFKVSTRDIPGSMANLCSMLTGMGITIHDCIPCRTWVKGEVFEMQYKMVVETRGWYHTKKLVEQIKKNYTDYHFLDTGDRPDLTPKVTRGPCLAPNPICMQK